MSDLKKTIVKLAALAVILIGMNYFYAAFFFEGDLQKYSPEIRMIQNIPADAEVLYLGESSNSTWRDDDQDKRRIGEMIGDFYPELRFYDLTRPAAHAGIFKVLLSNIPKDSKIRTVIVTLNLRSFNAQWVYSDQETGLQQNMVLLRPYPPLVNRMLLSFKDYDIKTDEERIAQFKEAWLKDELPGKFKNVTEWDNWMAVNGIRNPNGTINQSETELACHYIKAYAFRIDPDHHVRIKDLDDIIRLAEKRNWRLVFNLMAENVEKAQELVGDELVFLMDENRKMLVRYITNKGVIVVDNFKAVENREFIDQNWTTEHYAQKGRRTIARNVAGSLKKYYPDQFRDVERYPGSDPLNYHVSPGTGIHP
ncbi:MAG: hypothetical protein JW801_17770 [Bacteroidales bacterium]|nr:hypothetical protein [Bacteroidales bacterium]